MKSIRVKAEQLAETGAELIVTPCHNCHSGIEDIVGHYKLGMHVKFISELLVKAIDLGQDKQEVAENSAAQPSAEVPA